MVNLEVACFEAFVVFVLVVDCESVHDFTAVVVTHEKVATSSGEVTSLNSESKAETAI
jgi:hypothetical protein